MGLFGDITGYIDTGRAAKSVSDANIAAEHGVLNAAGSGQQAITDRIGTNTNAVNDTLSSANTNLATAGNNVNDAAGSANGTLADLYNTTNQNLAPSLQSGAQGNTSLQQYAASNPQFNFAPTQAQLEQTPGYQFQLQQGTSAITNSASAMGLNQSGKALTDLTQYGQGLAGTYYQNAFNNAQSQFQTNQNTTLSNLNSLISSGAQGNTLANSNSQFTGGQMSTNSANAANTNANLAEYGAGLNTGAQTTLAGQNLSGQESSNLLGLNGAEAAGDFAVGAGQAHATGIVNQGADLNSGVTDLGSLAKVLIPGAGGN